MAYLVDHVSIHAAFVICSGVSIALLLSYLRLVAGMRAALLEAGLAQFVYLVLFSYAFFFEGFTGLAITIGADAHAVHRHANHRAHPVGGKVCGALRLVT